MNNQGGKPPGTKTKEPIPLDRDEEMAKLERVINGPKRLAIVGRSGLSA